MTRHLSADEAGSLSAGDDHYRAYVGPPGRFGLLTLLQMNLLAALGLEETDAVLDFGCGSLRLGRSLIPYLRAGGYFGIDPNGWLIEEGFVKETGSDLRTLKAPRFSTDSSFDCTVFGETFDFIIAQSIITHAGPKSTRALIESAGRALRTDGVFVLSFLLGEDDAPPPEAEWTYPHNVAYPEPWLSARCDDAGLSWRRLDWHHPGATWAAIARDPRRLEPLDETLGVAGRAAPRWRG